MGHLRLQLPLVFQAPIESMYFYYTCCLKVLELLEALVAGGFKPAQDAILHEVLVSKTPSFLPALYSVVMDYNVQFPTMAVRAVLRCCAPRAHGQGCNLYHSGFVFHVPFRRRSQILTQLRPRHIGSHCGLCCLSFSR